MNCAEAGMPAAGQFSQNLKGAKEKPNLNQSQDRIIKKNSFARQALDVDQPVANRGIGLFATVNYSSVKDTLCSSNVDSKKPALEQAWLDNLLSESSIAGISCLIPWREIEETEETYNWQILDTLLNYCQRHNKLLILRVSTAGLDTGGNAAFDEQIISDTPAWVFTAGAQSLTYREPNQDVHRMPVLWDAVYLAKWSNFVKQLGNRYDKNSNLHSIGITGGGTLGGTNIIPPVASNKSKCTLLEEELKDKYGMCDRQLISNWKYIGDLFVKSFPSARLNFDINPPIPDHDGQELLDEIANYFIFRYGERVYLTRQNVSSSKHDFDQYRLILKFRPDTLTGYQIVEQAPAQQAGRLRSQGDAIALTNGGSAPSNRINSGDPNNALQVAEQAERLRSQFDQYRLILKSRPDTLTGYQTVVQAPAGQAGCLRSQGNAIPGVLSATSRPGRGGNAPPTQLNNIIQCALDDGISFAEVPAELILSQDASIKKSLKNLEDHIGYQLVAKKITLPTLLKSGEALPASFTFLNLGAAAPMKPVRELDKEKAGSYKIQIVLKDQNGSPVVISLHTPNPPTNLWTTGKPISWAKDLKMPKLEPGIYSVSLSLIDVDCKQKLNILNKLTPEPREPTSDLDLDKIEIIE